MAWRRPEGIVYSFYLCNEDASDPIWIEHGYRRANVPRTKQVLLLSRVICTRNFPKLVMTCGPQLSSCHLGKTVP